MNCESVPSFCFFCASLGPVTLITSNLINKTETESDLVITTGYVPIFTTSSLTFVISEETRQEAAAPKLASILKHILGVEEDKLKTLLGKFQEQIKVCNNCGQVVQNFYQVFKEMSTLQKKLSTFSGELKGRICQTKDIKGVNNGLCAWKIARDEMIAEIEGSSSTCNEALLVCDPVLENGCQPPVPDFSLMTHLQQSEPVAVQPPTSQKKRKNAPGYQTISSPAVSQLMVPQYLSFKKDKRTYYKCSACPAQYPDLGRMKSHLELHVPRSSFTSTSCQLCGWVLDPDKLRFHNARHHPLLPRGSHGHSHYNHHQTHQQQQQQQQHHHHIPPPPPPPPQTFSQLNYAHHRPYTSYKKGARLYYKCSACPYESPDLSRMKSHLELHRPGARATACGACGVFLEPEKVSLHNARQHGKKKG